MPTPKQDTAEQDAALVAVTIIVDNHTHDGEEVPNGATIRVDKDTAAWLLANKLIEG